MPWGWAEGLARMAQAVEDDERALLAACSMLTPECLGVPDVALSLPRVLGAVGVVEDKFEPGCRRRRARRR